MENTVVINKQHLNLTIKDPFSALTHFIGIIYSAILTPFIMTETACKHVDNMTLISIAVFMISMVLLYTASTVYHTFDLEKEKSLVLKRFDHSMIFILIAGSYTPVCLIPLRSGIGPVLLAVVWAIAFLGILFKLCWVTCPKWVSSVIYIGLGWSVVFALPTLFQALPLRTFLWLLIGGIIYTAGGILYALKLKAFNNRNPDFGSHEWFHIFVMIGNLCHFVCMWQLI